MRKITVLLLALSFGLVISAHEFWIQPDRFLYAPAETINLRFWVGENFEGENWQGNSQSVAGIFVRQNKLADSLTASLGEDAGDSLELSFHDEGTAMIILQTKNGQVGPETGNELYQRSVKTIVQVGDELSACCLKETGLPVDIIPVKNPYDPALKDSLRFLVKFEGQPLKNQLMKAWHRHRSQVLKFETLTNDKGIFSVPVAKHGKWMVSTEHKVSNEEENAQWQSYWASCTWGYY